MNNNKLTCLYLDLNSFFAKAEQNANPRLQGRPVVVAPLDSEHTCAIAASPEAKAFGIKTGTPIAEARQRCPGVIVVPARHDLYVDIHHQVLSVLAGCVAIEAVCSIDEMACRLSPDAQTPDAARALALKIKARMREKLGPILTASIGLAPNRFLAKLASDMQKPDGLVVLEHAALPQAIVHLPIRDLCGVGRAMEQRLNRFGIWRMAELWDLTPRRARQVWGSVAGETFWYDLHGFVRPYTETHKSVIGHSRILDPDLRAPDEAEQVATRLTLKSCQRLRRCEHLATDFDVGVRCETGPRWRTSVRLRATDDSREFLRVLHAAWRQMVREIHPSRIKKVSVALHGLSPIPATTGDLFAYAAQQERAQTAVRPRPAPALSAALDTVNRKFGANTVHIGEISKTVGAYTGTKIAFSRIPDAAEFKE